MMHKMVDGKRVDLTEAECTALKKEWAENDAQALVEQSKMEAQQVLYDAGNNMVIVIEEMLVVLKDQHNIDIEASLSTEAAAVFTQIRAARVTLAAAEEDA